MLKTPPATPCVFGGNMDVISRLDTVKIPSAPIGFRKLAIKAQAQYDHIGLSAALISDPESTGNCGHNYNPATRTRWTITPTTTLVNTPEAGASRKYRAVPRWLMFCTSWKKFRYCSKALKAAQMQKMLMQIQEKTLWRHKEFGVSAERLSRSWRRTQRTKARRNAKASISREILAGDRMSKGLPVIALYNYQCPTLYSFFSCLAAC